MSEDELSVPEQMVQEHDEKIVEMIRAKLITRSGEQGRKDKWLADTTILKEKVLKNELISKDEVRFIYNSLIVNFRAALCDIPSTSIHEIKSCSSAVEVTKLLRQRLREASQELNDIERPVRLLKRSSEATEIANEMFKALKPPPELTVSEWADEFRYLSPESSASPGKWRTSKAEYQRGIMDSTKEPGVKRVVIMSSAQVGKTSFVENIIGYFTSYDPCPIMVVNPTLEMSTTFSQDRLSTMIRDTPILTETFGDPKSKSSGNTILKKNFKGGVLTMVGANSPSSLASRPIRVVLFDEVDRFPSSAGTEGDPISLGKKRTATFWNSLVVEVSTPTVKHDSRIEMSFLESDQRYFHVKCPKCETEQRLLWKNVVWTDSNASTAIYTCDNPECDHEMNDGDRYRMVKSGRWIATAPFNEVAGFHLNELYSPWRKLSDIVQDFLNAKDNPETLKTFINTSLGETFEEQGEKADPTALINRVEEYGTEGYENVPVPEGVLFITMGVDVQQDRIEAEVIGWGEKEESWSLEYHILLGDTTDDDVWEQLSQLLTSTYNTVYDKPLNIEMTLVDSGFNTSKVYEFTNKYSNSFCKPCKGISGKHPIIEDRTKKVRRKTKAKVDVEMIGADNAKHVIYSYLQTNIGSTGYCHFTIAHCDEMYFEQLTAEKRITKYRKGFAIQEWVKESPRNEVLDCRIYGYAAMKIKNPNFEAIKEMLMRDTSQDGIELKRDINVRNRNSVRGSRVRMKSR